MARLREVDGLAPVKALVIAAALVFAGAANAAENDYEACLVGQATIVLWNMPKPVGYSEALDQANAACARPAGMTDKAFSDVQDYATDIIEDVAGALNLSSAE